MGAVNQPQSGPVGTIAQVPIVFNNALAVGVAGANTDILQAGGLPGLRAWFRVTGLVVATVTVTLQFANGQGIAGPNWQPLRAPFAIDPTGTIPALVSDTLGSRFYRAVIVASGNTTVSYRLVGTLT